jgi:hypothetical protein
MVFLGRIWNSSYICPVSGLNTLQSQVKANKRRLDRWSERRGFANPTSSGPETHSSNNASGYKDNNIKFKFGWNSKDTVLEGPLYLQGTQ